MKIFSIVRNYSDLYDEQYFGSGDPVWYEIPDSSLLRSGQPFFVPDFACDFRAFPTVVYRISRLGKGIKARFASRYLDAMTMGCCVVAVDMLQDLKSKGNPWTRAVAFDKCCMLGTFESCADFTHNWTVRCGENQILYNPENIRYDVADIIENLSRDITIKEGDLLMTALHPSGLPLSVGSGLAICSAGEDNTNSNKILDINIR